MCILQAISSKQIELVPTFILSLREFVRGILQESTKEWELSWSPWTLQGLVPSAQTMPLTIADCADKLYCKSCFNSWGWYMKSGANVFRLAADCNLADSIGN